MGPDHQRGKESDPRKWVRKADLARIHDVSPRQIDYWRSRRIISYLPLSAGLLRFDPDEVERNLSRFDMPATVDLGAGGIDDDLILRPDAGEGFLGLAGAAPATIAGVWPIRVWIRKAKLAKALDISERTINNWMTDGRIPYRRLPGGHPRFCLEEVVAALRRVNVPAVVPPEEAR